MNKPKQIIIMRKDLNMRKGKMIAQGCHASLAAVLSQTYYTEENYAGEPIRMFNNKSGPLKDWLDGQFTKICVSVNSEQELIDIINKAKDAGLITSLITDAGHTEFNGVPTITCGAVGPAYSNDLIGLTDHLPLL